MSTRAFRSIRDFVRHGRDIELTCRNPRCRHRAVLSSAKIDALFTRKGWSTSLVGASWSPSAHARFRCSKCGERGPRIENWSRG